MLRYVGRISYGLYLYHVPVFYALEIDAKAAENRVTTAEVLTAYALSFAAAMLSYHLMEKRIVAFGKRFRGGRPRPTNDVLATPGAP